MDGWDEAERLQEAASYGDVEIVKECIDEGIDLNEIFDEDGTTILMIAASEGQLEVVKLLVESGADVNVLSEGNSPLIYAICGRHKDVYEFLLPHVKNSEILQISQKYLSDPTLQWDTTRRKNKQTGLFMEAACEGDLETIRHALGQGIYVDELDHGGTPALQWAAIFGHLQIVQFLLDSGAEPNGICRLDDGTPWSSTLIELAKKQGKSYTEIIRALIDAGADVNFIDSDKKTALFYLIQYGQISDDIYEAVQLLYHVGADLNIVSREGQSILERARSKRGMNKVAAFLELFGAKPSPKIIVNSSQQNSNYKRQPYILLP